MIEKLNVTPKRTCNNTTDNRMGAGLVCEY